MKAIKKTLNAVWGYFFEGFSAFYCIKKHGYIYSCIPEFISIENIYNGTFEYQFLL